MASRIAKAVVIILCLTGWIAEVTAGQGRTGTTVGTATPRDAGSKSGGDSGSSSSGGNSSGSGGSTSSSGQSGTSRRGHVVGKAVPRGSVPVRTGPTEVVYVPAWYGYYPWGYAGLGFGGYYGGFYDLEPPPIGLPYYEPGPGPDGGLRLKVQPREAVVYVDGYRAGTVEDYDGWLQRLHIDAGPHRIEIRMSGYEPLEFDVRIEPGHTTTYHGELKKIR